MQCHEENDNKKKKGYRPNTIKNAHVQRIHELLQICAFMSATFILI